MVVSPQEGLESELKRLGHQSGDGERAERGRSGEEERREREHGGGWLSWAAGEPGGGQKGQEAS